MSVHKVGASVVVVDAKAAAEMRNKMAYAKLSDKVPEQRSVQVIRGLIMTVPYTLKIVCPVNQDCKAKSIAEKYLSECFEETDMILNNYNPESEISKINDSQSTEPFKISPVLMKVLLCSLEVNRSSRGTFDIACGPALQWIREHPRYLHTPEEQAELKKILKYSSLRVWTVDHAAGTITKSHPKARLDLGGISKGYTVDRIIETFSKHDYKDVFFDWAGDVRAIGFNASGKPWSVGIIRPPDIDDLFKPRSEEPQLLRVINLEDEAMATSGDYENLVRNTSENKKCVAFTTNFDPTYGHVLFPSDKKLAQVSVKNTSCMYADALATAALMKHDARSVRLFLENWRYIRNPVTDYTTYTRNGESMSYMRDIAHEDEEMRQKRISESLPARVIVVGGGLAGLSAALQAADCGANAVLIEKTSQIGGNSAKATSGINGWGSRAQGRLGIVDNDKLFERDTFLSGEGGLCDHSLVKTLSLKSAESIHWLSKKFNLPLTVLSQLGGHSRPRTHRAPDLKDGTPVPIGYTIMRHLETACLANSRISILTETLVTSLISSTKSSESGSTETFVDGIYYKQKDFAEPVALYADAVILATGGFGNDHSESSLIREFAPHLISHPTTNGAGTTGDGVKMARSIGAHLVDMDKLQLHPTGLLNPKDPANNTKYLGPEALRGSGGIIVNRRGLRFVNELDLRSVVSNAIIEQNDVYPNSNGCKYAYCILNEVAHKLFGPSALGFYMNTLGLFSMAENITELAKLIGCPVDTITHTLKEYEAISTSKTTDPLTGKAVYPCVISPQGPFYIALITPTIHYTMGGCLINPSAEILSKENPDVLGGRRPIHRLFGAGEVTGGVHGRNRLGGNSLLECVVFGRIAGDRAATILQKKPKALSFDSWGTVVLREFSDGGEFGQGSRVLRFNLPGALQKSGLQLGQFIAIRGEWDGQQLIGYYSPITLPSDVGVIGILARIDKGRLKDWIGAFKPGDAVEMKAFGGLAIHSISTRGLFMFNGTPIRQIAMIAGGTGVAPMLQIIRAALKMPYLEGITSLRLIYAAENAEELTYRSILENFMKDSRKKFMCHFVLNSPPAGWTKGVGFIDSNALKTYVQPPANDLLIAICGPPIMQRIIKSTLIRIGHAADRVRTVDETNTDPVAKI